MSRMLEQPRFVEEEDFKVVANLPTVKELEEEESGDEEDD